MRAAAAFLSALLVGEVVVATAADVAMSAVGGIRYSGVSYQSYSTRELMSRTVGRPLPSQPTGYYHEL
jgi:hypothetical protein